MKTDDFLDDAAALRARLDQESAHLLDRVLHDPDADALELVDRGRTIAEINDMLQRIRGLLAA